MPKDRFCRVVSIVLRGKLDSVAADGTSFTMKVRTTNRWARRYWGREETVNVDSNTKIWRQGQKVALADLTVGDKLNVRARACWRHARVAGTPLALRVVAIPAKPAATTTTTTTTTSSSP